MYRRMQMDIVSPTVASGAADSEHHRPPTPLPLLDQYLAEQQELSAVARFARLHEAHTLPVQEKYYRSLIPLSQPGIGQQYGFEVDLDRCSGCKACVTACHSMNGLEAGETWRMVGLLHGGTPAQPIQKTVTTTCHHCLEPACMHGCPVGAYEKDGLTGIVRHLDDQCIGCRYCMLTCPYEVPQYSVKKGIVRKCDMCAERLADGEAPACVQACPNAAIAIRIVDRATAIEDAQSNAFLPGVPSPGITIPTTNYTTQQAFPRNMLPADFYTVRTAHQHLPLVLMLVLTQLSVGTFCLDQLLPLWLNPATLHLLRPLHATLALLLGVVALLASTVHLGRPQYAWRVFIGLRTSWLSREIIAFAAFALLAALYAAARYQFDSLPAVVRQSVDGLGRATALVGVLALFSSVMLYHVTRRQWWSGGRTGFKFVLTGTVLGWAVMLTVAFSIAALRGAPLRAELIAFGHSGACSLAALTLLKLGGEAAIFLHLRDRQQGDLKRSALLLTGDLRNLTCCRFLLGLFGGIFIPLVFLSGLTPTRMGLAIAASICSLICLLVGEIFERMTFFTALSAPRMPGGLS